MANKIIFNSNVAAANFEGTATRANLLNLDWKTLGTAVYNIYDVDWEYTNGEDEENLGQNIWSISGTPRDMSYIDLSNVPLGSGLYIFAIFEKVDFDTTEIVANDMHKATFLMYVQDTGWNDRLQGVSTARGGGSYFEIEESDFYSWSDFAIDSAPYIDEDPNEYAEYHETVTCLRLYDKNGNNITKSIDMDTVWLYYAKIG